MNDQRPSSLPSRASRRTLLTGAIAAGAGIALGQLSQPSTVTTLAMPKPPPTPAPHRRTVEAQGMAAPGPQDIRLGAQQVTWSVKTQQPMASVTFDDGPDPAFTPRVLEALREAGVKVTFMVMGWLWLWSVTRGPTDPGVPADVVDWVGTHTQAGDIVDLHDSIGWHVRDRTTAYAEMLIARREVEILALPKTLATIKDRGISLVPMTTLASSARNS